MAGANGGGAEESRGGAEENRGGAGANRGGAGANRRCAGENGGGAAANVGDAAKSHNTRRNMIVPQANDVIRFKEHEEDSWHEATVISRAGKQTSDKGLNKLCVNVKSADDGKASCINLRNVNVWEKIIERILWKRQMLC